MDWPVVGAVTGVGVLTCVVGVSAYALMRSAPAPAERPPIAQSFNFHSMLGPTVYPIQNGLLEPETPTPHAYDDGASALPAARKGPTQRPASDDLAKAPAKVPSSPDQRTMASLNPNGLRPEAPPPPVVRPQAPAATPEVVQWRVVKTAKAGMMNLGGHIDNNGIVDSMANSHLRDALVKHANFGKLPPAIQTHIRTQSIDLNRLAPYRGLLGMDDRKMEEEQGVRFERVARR